MDSTDISPVGAGCAFRPLDGHLLLEVTGLVGRNVDVREDCRDRTLRLARPAIDALVWVDIE